MRKLKNVEKMLLRLRNNKPVFDCKEHGLFLSDTSSKCPHCRKDAEPFLEDKGEDNA